MNDSKSYQAGYQIITKKKTFEEKSSLKTVEIL